MPESLCHFAYGSNLDLRKLDQFGVRPRLIGIGTLPEHRLGFTYYSRTRWRGGTADVVPQSGSAVWGALWAVTLADQVALDGKESTTRTDPAYVREESLVYVDGDPSTRLRAFFYRVARPSLRDHLPSLAYLDSMIQGARDVALPSEWITNLEAMRAKRSVTASSSGASR